MRRRNRAPAPDLKLCQRVPVARHRPPAARSQRSPLAPAAQPRRPAPVFPPPPPRRRRVRSGRPLRRVRHRALPRDCRARAGRLRRNRQPSQGTHPLQRRLPTLPCHRPCPLSRRIRSACAIRIRRTRAGAPRRSAARAVSRCSSRFPILATRLRPTTTVMGRGRNRQVPGRRDLPRSPASGDPTTIQNGSGSRVSATSTM